jgi:pimeloyl-ACP methyl ester carboxylesterase
MSDSSLAYVEAGQGLPIVLLHGFCETKEIWKSFMEPLSKKFRVIAVDLPGFGENPPLFKPVTIADIAEQIYNFVHDMGLDKVVMIGHSMGGYVSLAFAEKFPMRLAGLGLFHSTAYSDNAEKKHARDKTIEFIERYGTEEFVDEFVPPLFFEGRKKDLKEEIKMVIEMGKNTSKMSVIEAIRAMRDRKDRTKVLEKIACPVLFIVGKNDIAVNFSSSVNQFWLPAYSTVHILNNTGHMGMLERSAETCLMVEHFVEQIEIMS